MANENNVSKTPVTNDDNTYILKVANDERNILASALIDQPEPPIESQIPPGTEGLSQPTVIELRDEPQESLAVAATTDRINQQGSLLLSEERKRYRINFGTRPGFYVSDQFTYEQSQWRHEQLIDALSQFQHQAERSGLKAIQFDIILRDAFSTTESWGLEPYASIIFESSLFTRVQGLAAIIGQIFRQDAIGIFDEEEDYQDQQVGWILNGFQIHRFFAISRSDASGTSIAWNEDGRILMSAIRTVFENLSGQFGRSNDTIELHEFGNYNQEVTADQIKDTILECFNNPNHSYQVVERKAKSILLLADQYDQAIEAAELELLATLIKVIRLHDTVYNNN